MRREYYWMISKYVKEQKRYTQDELRKIFECTADETVQIIRKLKEYGIVKNVKKSDRQSMLSDLVEEDIRVTDIESGERELYYVFSFVGVIVVYGRVLKCYPKYINSCGSPIAQMKQIMRVLEKYNSKEQVIKLYNESDDGGSFNLLAVMLYLLQDYYDNGIYANDVEIVETNGTGEILWDRTINETFSYISNNRPYYTELQTKKRTSDEYDFIRRLHACILTKFSKELEESDLPIEYYDITWTTFARDVITTRSIPYKSSLIDSSEYRYQSGNDLYLSRIIKGSLEPEDITSIAQAHRKMRDTFINDPSIEAINNKINQDASLTDKKIALSVELVTKNAWENSLVTQLDEIPFHYMGKGEQCVVKTELALAKRTSQNASIILLEEPENHLSHTRLNQLIKCISEQYAEKQILISTHSSFVANKLGLGKVMLLDNLRITKFSELSEDTYNFFKKVAGYDTLRMILCKKAILCEGDSDELVIQKAYMQLNDGRLPIEDGIEVISVGVSFLRFLEIADCIQTKSRLLQITMGIWQLSTKSMKII